MHENDFLNEPAPNPFETKVVKKKISPDSPEYTEHLRVLAELDTSRDDCFGSSLVNFVRAHDALTEAYGDSNNPEHQQALAYKSLNVGHEDRTERLYKEAREKLVEYICAPRTRYRAQQMICDAIEDSPLDEKWEHLLHTEEKPNTPENELLNILLKKKSPQLRPKFKKFIYLLDNGTLPDELLFDVLAHHQNEFLTLREEFEKNLPEFRARLQDSLLEGVQRGEIPLPEEKITRTIPNTPIVLEDELVHVFHERFGSYDSINNKISVGIGAFSHGESYGERGGELEMPYHVVVHEVFHALSGKTVIATTEIDTANHSPSEEATWYETTRIGFRAGKALRWINEAITEELSCMYSKGTKSSYEEERKLLQAFLRQCGMTIEDLLPAYFEDYHPDERDSPGGAISEWKKLQERINNKFGVNELARLDGEVRKKGVSKVLEEYEPQASQKGR